MVNSAPRSSYKPLPATRKATDEGAEVLEIHHDLYDPTSDSATSSTVENGKQAQL